MVTDSKYTRCVNVGVLRQLGVSYEDINASIEIIREIAFLTGDQGSCVVGGGLKANGQIVITAYSQGNTGPERCYAKIKNYLSNQYPKIKFEIEWGNMD